MINVERVEASLRAVVEEYDRISGQEDRINSAATEALRGLGGTDAIVGKTIIRQAIHDYYAADKQRLVRHRVFLVSLLSEGKGGTNAWMDSKLGV